MWFYDGGCFKGLPGWRDVSRGTHGFRTWARGERQRAQMVNSYQVCVCEGKRWG